MLKMILTQMWKHPAVLPVVGITALGVSMATVQVYRLLFVSTDMSFRRISNPHPWIHVRPDENHKVIPVFVITCCGATMATLQIFRSSYVYPDVSFRRYSNPHPWVHVKPDENRKFIKALDYSKIEQDERPEF